jgi:hypothetical protein
LPNHKKPPFCRCGGEQSEMKSRVLYARWSTLPTDGLFTYEDIFTAKIFANQQDDLICKFFSRVQEARTSAALSAGPCKCAKSAAVYNTVGVLSPACKGFGAFTGGRSEECSGFSLS